jgi:hypothetical protein
LNIKICRAQTIEIARRFYCNQEKIKDFFLQHMHLFNRDPRLIWNADETQLNSKKRFKVLCSHGKLPLVTSQSKFPHLPGVVAISATGQLLKPLIILKSLKKLKSLSQFSDLCYFSTSLNGWITKELFIYFAFIFVQQISHYRLSLPDNIREERILLILDGHSTRLCFDAALIFSIWNIDVLILPSHSSHLIQPFDVAVASPAKVEFKKELDKHLKEIMDTDPEKREKSAKL